MSHRKKPTEGEVIEVGWEPNSPTTQRVYVVIKVRLSKARTPEKAEQNMEKIRKKLLNKKVAVFPQ